MTTVSNFSFGTGPQILLKCAPLENIHNVKYYRDIWTKIYEQTTMYWRPTDVSIFVGSENAALKKLLNPPNDTK